MIWLKTTSPNNVVCLETGTKLNVTRPVNPGPWILRVIPITGTASDLPGEYVEQADAQRAMHELTRSFDASLYVPAEES